MKTVLVLDANQRSALATTRSLGDKNILVYAADEEETALAGCSRHSKLYLTYPSPRLYPEKFIATLMNLIVEHHIDILMPMTELTSILVKSHQAVLAGVIIPMPDIDTINSLADKCQLFRAADSMSIPVPITKYCLPKVENQFKPEELCYPMVLKPGKSWQYVNGSWFRAGVRFAHNPSELREIIASDPAFHSHPYMLQEYIEGQGQGIFALYDSGRPLAFFSHRRLREKPPHGGVSVLSESQAINPVLLTHARTLLTSAQWHGVAMVEYIVTKSGTPYLMEINTRFWGSLQLAVDAGVDFPYMLYQLSCNTKPDTVEQYKTGIRLRWLLGDLDNLYLTLRSSRYSLTSKLKAILNFVTWSPRKTRHEINRWSDLMPAWCEIKQYLRDILD